MVDLEAISDEFMKKYGRLDWNVSGATNVEKAKEGKRYEGLPILMNLNSGSILSCDVIKVTEEGFLVKPLNITRLFCDDKDDDDDLDYSMPIPFNKFFSILLRNS